MLPFNHKKPHQIDIFIIIEDNICIFIIDSCGMVIVQRDG
jgi:hypothetical protein